LIPLFIYNALEERKVRYTSIEAIAAYYVREMQTVQPAGPYYIGGHSIGGLIALEMAQQLQKLDQEVALLVVLDSGPPPRTQPLGTNHPSHHSREEPFAKTRAVRRVKKNLWWFARHRIDETLQNMTKAVRCQVYHHFGIPLPPALKTFYVDQVVYGTIYPKAHRSYVPRAYSGRAVYLKSEDTRERVAGWEKLMTRGLEVRAVTGNHLSMLSEPHLKSLAQTLKECLAEAQERARSSTQSCQVSSVAKREQTPSKVRLDPAAMDV